MSELSNVISELVAKGWPRDYYQVAPPCWYLLSEDWSRLEDPDFAPDVAGRPATLVIAPPAAYFLYVDVFPDGSLGSTTIEVHDGQGPMGDGTAGFIPAWPGLEQALVQARVIYLQWEVQMLREASHG